MLREYATDFEQLCGVGEPAGHGNHLRARGNGRQQAFLNVDDAEQGGGGRQSHDVLAVWGRDSIALSRITGGLPRFTAHDVWKVPPEAVAVLMLVPFPEIVLPVTVVPVETPLAKSPKTLLVITLLVLLMVMPWAASR